MSSYRVGKGKPPKTTRFQKGVSGNPKGRPKGSFNLSTLIGKQLNARVTIRENGKEKRVTGAEAISLKLIAEAYKGNYRALQTVVAIGEKMAANSEQQHSGDFSALDMEIIRRFAPPLLAKKPEKDNES